MPRRRTAAIVLVLAVGLLASPATAAAAKAGAPCAKKGAQAVGVSGKRLVCAVSGKRLVWQVKPAAAASTPAPVQMKAGDFTIVATAKRIAFPKWEGRDFDDKAWATASLSGHVSLVNVWASWCGPCREEWDDLQAAAAAHPDVTFIGLNTIDRMDEARSFLKEHPTAYLQVFDGNGVVKASLTTVPNRVLPLTMIVDAKGRIAAWVPGPTTKTQIATALASI